MLGSGPIRIGQGIEFDYCSVRAAQALREAGVRSIMINSNPETVSTDFDMSDRLYFEPLDAESVLAILENERGPRSPSLPRRGEREPERAIRCPRTAPAGVRPAPPGSSAGRPPLGWRRRWSAAAPMLGTSLASIDVAEDRRQFDALMERLACRGRAARRCTSVEAALAVADEIGYPRAGASLVRARRARDGDRARARRSWNATSRGSIEQFGEHPILIDRYLVGREVEVDAICDGDDVLIPGIMEHIERAGVHSGDSFAVYPTAQPQRRRDRRRRALHPRDRAARWACAA